MAWRLKLSSTFVYGASSTCVHATTKMRTSSTKDIGGVERAGPTGPEPLPDIDGDDALLCALLLVHLPDLVSYSLTSTCFSSHGRHSQPFGSSQPSMQRQEVVTPPTMTHQTTNYRYVLRYFLAFLILTKLINPLVSQQFSSVKRYSFVVPWVLVPDAYSDRKMSSLLQLHASCIYLRSIRRMRSI